MCQTKSDGGKRCAHDSNGTRAIGYEAERGYGLDANYVKKASTAFRKEAIHNGISDTEDAPREEVEAFVEERREAIEKNERMKPAEKRTAIRRWARALKEKVSMATLYSWKKVAAIMVAGSILTFASACTRAEEKVPEPPAQTQTQEANPTETGKSVDSGTVDKDEISKEGPFGYDYSNIPVSDKIKEQYGEKAAGNILNDTFTPMEVMKTTTNLYKPGDKSSDTYMPLKPYMTPEAWERNAKAEDSDKESDIFTATAFSCDEDGKMYIVKKGKKGDDNPDSYTQFTCDETQPVSNTKILDVKVDTYKKTKDDSMLVDIPQHVTVSGTQKQTFTGKDEKVNPQWQTMDIDFTYYLVPDSKKKDHWLLDSAGWKYDYGQSSYNK